MTDEVDVNSLHDFKSAMDGRLEDLENVLTELDGTDRLNRVLPAGEFTAGLDMQRYYSEDRLALWELVVKLKNATTAIQTATGTIAEQYTTTEEQNSLNTDQVAGILDEAGVPKEGE